MKRTNTRSNRGISLSTSPRARSVSRSSRSSSTIPLKTHTSSSTTTTITTSAPHTIKNPYIQSGYTIHKSSKEAWLSAFLFSQGIHNEHINIFTGFLMFFVALWTYLQTTSFTSYSLSFTENDNYAIRILAYAELWNTIAVVTYHSLLSVPSLYHIVSAFDLLGISLLQIGLVYGHTITGVSSWSIYSQHLVNPSSSVGLLFGLLSSDNAIYYHLSIIVLAAFIVVSIRIYIQKESPPILIFINIIWYFILFFDYVLIRSSTLSTIPLMILITLLSGAILYGIKFPERYYPGKFDIIGHSHSIWHCCYVFAFALYSYDITNLAYYHALAHNK